MQYKTKRNTNHLKIKAMSYKPTYIEEINEKEIRVCVQHGYGNIAVYIKYDEKHQEWEIWNNIEHTWWQTKEQAIEEAKSIIAKI